jgi:pyruvate dehydrogenase E1 component alpha subunit
VGDVDRAYYRSKEEEESWSRERDPIALLAGRLTAAGAVRPDQLEALDEEVRTMVAEGVAFALAAPFPELSEVTEDVYA